MASSILFLAFGAAGTWLLGLRSPLLIIVAALPTGIGLLVLTSHVVGTLGLQTTIVLDAVAALAVAATIGGLRRRWKRGAPAAPSAVEAPGPLVWAGGAVGAALAMGVWLAGIGNFEIPPQGNDDIWHGYLVERLTHMPVITAGSVAPIFVDSPQPVVYYPYGLHLSGALIHEFTGVSVPEILNGSWVMDVGLLLPFGVAALAWQLFPDRRWVAFWSGALSAAVTAFPYLTNGILPYTASLAMIPGLLALVLAFIDQRLSVPTFALAVVAVGLFVTHPGGALAAAVLAALVTTEHVLRSPWPGGRSIPARRLGAVGALVVIGSLPWILAVGAGALGAPPANAAVGGIVPAVWMFLGLASPWTPPQPALAILTAVGVVAGVVTRRAIGLSVGLLVFGVLFVGVIAGLRGVSALTGPWYGNWYRLLAVVGLIVPILAGLGLVSLIGLSRRYVKRIATPRAFWALAVMAVGIGSVTIVASAREVARGQSIVRSAWHSTGLVTAQDLELLRALTDRLRPGDRVLNSPRDGSTWMYALYGATPVLPYVYGPAPWLPHLLSGTGAYRNAVAACRGLAKTGATYAFVKTVRGDISDEDYDIAGFVSRHPDLFTRVLSAESGVIYRIEPLTQCR